MKNGKLFGKLNIIDILVLLILIAAVVFVGMRLIGHGAEAPATETPQAQANLRYTFLSNPIPRELAENAVAAFEGEDADFGGTPVSPRRIYNNNLLVDAMVTDWEISEAPDDMVYLHLTIEATATYSTGRCTVGSQDLRIGVSYTAKTLVVEVVGRVTGVEKLS